MGRDDVGRRVDGNRGRILSGPDGPMRASRSDIPAVTPSTIYLFLSFFRFSVHTDKSARIMILDAYKLQSFTVQVNYKSSFELWDRAGSIARSASELWGELKVIEGAPQQQVLSARDLIINTGFNQSSISLLRERLTNQQYIGLVKSMFEIWKNSLALELVERVSARSVYTREFNSIGEANAHLLSMGFAKWPKEKVFNQSADSALNGIEISFRFQDEKSFSIVRLKAEQTTFHAELDRDYVTDPIDIEKNKSVIDFDRGTLGQIDASKFRMDEWITGYFHVLRRDLGKVLEPSL